MSSNHDEEENVQLRYLEEILKLVESHRYLAAEKLYEKLSEASNSHAVFESVTRRLSELQSTLDSLRTRVAATHDALKTGDVDDSWTLGAHLFGVTTHYKLSEDGSLTVRLEGLLDNFPLFEQVAVIKEVDLFTQWVPCCNHAATVAKPAQADVVAHLSLHVAPITRDTLLRAYGSDCLLENGKIVVMGESIEDWPEAGGSSTNTVTVNSSGVHSTGTDIPRAHTDSKTGSTALKKPWLSTGWFLDRMVVHEFKAIAHVLSPTTAKTVIVARVDPRLHLPQLLLNFVIRNLAGVVLYMFQCQVAKVVEHPEGQYGERIRGDKGFYVDWLLPKIRAYCDLCNWDQPIIKSLYEIGIPPLNPPNPPPLPTPHDAVVKNRDDGNNSESTLPSSSSHSKTNNNTDTNNDIHVILS